MEPAIDLLGALRAVLRQPLLIAATALSTGAAVLVGSGIVPPSYRADASLLVKLGREFMYRPEIEGLETATMYRLHEMINSEIELLESRDLAGKVIDELGLVVLFPEIAAAEPEAGRAHILATAAFRDQLSVKAVVESSVIEVAFEHADADLAARAVNALVRHFEDKHLAVFGDDRVAHFEKAAEAARLALAAAEQAVAELRREHGLFDVPHQQRLLLEKRAALDGARKALVTDPAAADKVVEDARAELLRLRIAERELLGKYLPASRPVVSVQDQIAQVEAVLAKSATSAKEALDARRTQLDRQIEDADAEIRCLAEAGRQLDALERTAAERSATHRDASTRLEEARATAQLDHERRISVRVIDRATPPPRPQGLSRSKKAVLGAFAGLVLGLALAFFRHALRRPA